MKRFDKRVERQLTAEKSRGVLEPPARANGAHAGSPDAAMDPRALIPPLGLREYWYPALPAKKVGKRPLFWVMLGDELVFFRDRQGQVVALTDICPHRGASLSEGACFYRGYLTCPYHAATFDENGKCVAMLTEGPDSKMVGRLKARVYPTQQVRDWIFVWMGDGDPVPIEEDVPEEFFDPDVVVVCNYMYWATNWMMATENHGDAHNQLFVHRNAVAALLTAHPGRSRTPYGPQTKTVGDQALLMLRDEGDYYATEKNGTAPYQLYYPGVDGVWPLHRWRLLWAWFFKRVMKPNPLKTSEEWGYGHHMPCIQRTATSFSGTNSLWAVAVRPNLSRIVQFHAVRPPTRVAYFWEMLSWKLFHAWMSYNFVSGDNAAIAPCRWWTPENLSSTDSHLVKLRTFVLTHSRDALRRQAQRSNGQAGTPAGSGAEHEPR
jgi:phenylpropionate dioxygenase-like ring-hydroxylating dioxygenase large terminal subunit